jgi:hypothetical protein
MSRLRISIPSVTAMTPSSSPIATLPTASKRDSPVHRQAHPHQRAAQPEQRPHILKQDNWELGALGTANERPPRQPGPHLVGFVDGGPQRPALQHDRHQQGPERPGRRLDRMRVAQLLVAFEQREQ